MLDASKKPPVTKSVPAKSTSIMTRFHAKAVLAESTRANARVDFVPVKSTIATTERIQSVPCESTSVIEEIRRKPVLTESTRANASAKVVPGKSTMDPVAPAATKEATENVTQVRFESTMEPVGPTSTTAPAFMPVYQEEEIEEEAAVI